MTSVKTEPFRLSELDALRGVAALCVVLFHMTRGVAGLLPDLGRPFYYFDAGENGLQLFFAVSGFVILMTLERTKTASDFLVSRFSRLFPAFWTAMAITSLAIFLFPISGFTASVAQMAANATMASTLFGAPYIDPSYWTLTVELIFYFVMLTLWRLRCLGRIETILIGWMAIYWVWRTNPITSSFGDEILIAKHIPFFTIGIASYRIWTKARQWQQQIPVLLMAFATVAVWQDRSVFWLVWIGLTSLFALIVAGRLHWLNQKPLQWLGKISYPLYLIHQVLGYVFISRLCAVGLSLNQAIVITVAAMLGIATGLSRIVEQPAMTFIRRKWRERPQRLSAMSSRIVAG